MIVTKAGKLRYRGLTRAQLKVAATKLQSLLAYNVKVGLYKPPLTFLSAPDATTIGLVVIALQRYIAFKNPG
jgi:hypothetical protein